MPEANPVDFWTHYSYLCLKSKVCPLKSVIKNLKGNELCFPVENIRREHWPFLLSALSVDQSLTKISFWSNFPITEYKEISEKKKKKSNLLFPIPYGCSAKNIMNICSCTSQLLQSSKTLKVLMIENLFLRNEDIVNLSEGLKNSTIEKFSLAGCQLEDSQVETLCRSLQTTDVSWIDFSMCGLTISGLTYICGLIKAHHLKRSNDMFPQTLRYRLPILDEMKGLKRLSINNNDIGDGGVEILVESLQEDIWMKALDLQKCSIENEGARSILKILRSNAGLQLLDLRQNKIDITLIDRIALQLSLNNVQKKIKFELGDLFKPPKFDKAVKCRMAKAQNVHQALLSRPGSFTSMKKKLKANRSLRKENKNACIGNTEKKQRLTKDTYSQTTHFNDELNEVKNALLHEIRVQNSLKHLVKKYKSENTLLRKELEKMTALENNIFIDQETFIEITNIFEKFKRFLEAMKKYKLWECIDMLGVSEKSDIVLKPFIIDTTKKCMQLIERDSSTIGKMDSASSFVPAPKKEIPKEHPINHHVENKLKDVKKLQEKAHRNFDTVQKQIYAKEQKTTQNKVMKVFMDVRDNYSQSILSSQASGNGKYDHTHIENFYKQSKTMQHSYVTKSNNDNLMRQDKKSSNKKNVSSQTPLVVGASHRKESASHEITKSKISDPKIIQSSTSVSDISSDDLFREQSRHESLKSSEYKSLPTSKSVSKRESIRKSQVLKLSQGSGDHVLSHSLHSKNELSSDSNSTLRSSNIYLEKLPTDESSHHKVTSSRSSVKARTVEHITSRNISGNSRSSSSVSSIISCNSKKEDKTDSSGSKGDSDKSYLESVSDGSTDKDVKSMTLSEIYNSSVKDYSDLDQSNHSGKSSNLEESALKKVPLHNKSDSEKSVKMNSLKDQERTSIPVPSFHEKLPETSKDLIHESNPKTSKTEDLQPTSLKRDDSESSIPSLSDITTVSSKSLNTDSVMGQLSDIQ